MFFQELKMVRRRVRTATSFRARDLWHGGEDTDFTLEVYRLVPEDSQEALPGWLYGGPEVYGLRSEIDGLDRPLPEALSELWSTGRVQPGDLPGLLHAMEPQLTAPDFQPVLHRQFGRWLAILMPVGLLALWGFFVARDRYHRAVDAIYDARPSAEAFLAQPWTEGQIVVGLQGGLPLAGRLDETFQATAPRGVSAPLATDSRLGWTRAGAGYRPVLMAANAYFPRPGLLEVTLGSVLRLDEVGAPAELVDRLRREAPDIDLSLVLCQGWRSEPAPGGTALPIALALIAFVSLTGALVCAIVVPVFAVRKRRRHRQMDWALARLGGFRG